VGVERVGLLDEGSVAVGAADGDRAAGARLGVAEVRIEREEDVAEGRDVADCVTPLRSALDEAEVAEVVCRSIAAPPHHGVGRRSRQRLLAREDRIVGDLAPGLAFPEDPEASRQTIGELEARLLRVARDREPDRRRGRRVGRAVDAPAVSLAQRTRDRRQGARATHDVDARDVVQRGDRIALGR